MENDERAGVTIVELLVILFAIVILALVFTPTIDRSREAARRSSCANNLKHMGVVFRMYADEHNGLFPPTQLEYVDRSGMQNPGEIVWNFTPRISGLWPMYLSDGAVFDCPSTEPPFDYSDQDAFPDAFLFPGRFLASDGSLHDGQLRKFDSDYAYYGWIFDRVDDSESILSEPTDSNAPLATSGEIQFGPRSMIKAYQEVIREGVERLREKDYEGFNRIANKPIPVGEGMGTGGSGEIMRLSESTARFLITDTNNSDAYTQSLSEIWVMHDKTYVDPDAFNHPENYWERLPVGSNVLYMDGHVEFIEFQDEGSAPTNRGMAYWSEYSAPILRGLDWGKE